MRSWMKWATAASLALVAGTAVAADHTDGPAVKTDPATDINDVYAWTNGGKLALAMSVGGVTAPDAFSDAALYTFHLHKQKAFPEAPAADKSGRLTCKFASATEAECWVVGGDGKVLDYVKGDPSTEIKSESGKLRVHAAKHADPFFFFLAGLNKTIETVQTVAGTLSFYESGCPKLDGMTVTALQDQLTKDGNGPAVNNFAALNQLILVAEIDPSLGGDGDYVAVWGSTNTIGQ
jgi:hypothetical protein